MRQFYATVNAAPGAALAALVACAAICAACATMPGGPAPGAMATAALAFALACAAPVPALAWRARCALARLGYRARLRQRVPYGWRVAGGPTA